LLLHTIYLSSLNKWLNAFCDSYRSTRLFIPWIVKRLSPDQTWSDVILSNALVKAGRPEECRAILDELLQVRDREKIYEEIWSEPISALPKDMTYPTLGWQRFARS
jgi:hypothetical protein